MDNTEKLTIRFGTRDSYFKKDDGTSRPNIYPMTGKSISTDEIMTNISRRCTLTRADIISVFSALSEEIGNMFAMGRSCNIEYLGIFSPSLSCDAPDCAEGDVRPSSVHVAGVNFRPSKSLMQNIGHIECIPSTHKKSSAHIEQEQVLDFINKTSTPFSIGQFARHFCLTYATARRRLEYLATHDIIMNASPMKGRVLYKRR